MEKILAYETKDMGSCLSVWKREFMVPKRKWKFPRTEASKCLQCRVASAGSFSDYYLSICVQYLLRKPCLSQEVCVCGGGFFFNLFLSSNTVLVCTTCWPACLHLACTNGHVSITLLGELSVP